MANWDITTAGDAKEFETTLGTYHTKPLAIDTNHFLSVWQGSGSDGFAGIFEVNTTTWAITTASTPLEFDTENLTFPSTVLVDSNHAVVFWADSSSDGRCHVLTINTTTWAVTTTNVLEFDTQISLSKNAIIIDSNHILCLWQYDQLKGQVFEVNTTSWAVTTAAAVANITTSTGSRMSLSKIDSNHFISFYTSGSSTVGKTHVVTVNTSTWAVTTAESLQFADYSVNNAALYNSSYQIDSNHFVNFWRDTNLLGVCQVFEVNTTTWAVTTSNSSLTFDTQVVQTCLEGVRVSRLDTNHFIHVWPGPDTGASSAYDGFAQVFEVNTTTWGITTSAASFEFNTTQGEYPAISEIIAGTSGTTTKLLLTFSGSGDDGYAQVLNVEVPSGAASAIKTINGLAKASVKTVNGLAIASVKTWNGLA